MLDTYMKVATIINQEILTSYEGAGATSAIGSMKKWGGDIRSDIIKRVACIQKSVGQAAFCLSDYFELEANDIKVARISDKDLKILQEKTSLKGN